MIRINFKCLPNKAILFVILAVPMSKVQLQEIYIYIYIYIQDSKEDDDTYNWMASDGRRALERDHEAHESSYGTWTNSI